jgi:saccharopine dehydrogenase (NAD+, L-lysine forming)
MTHRNLKIGIIKETKTPTDFRSPLTPACIKRLKQKYKHLEFLVQPSSSRCFRDDEYSPNAVTLQKDLSDADILMGVKEVAIEKLIPHKTYIIFSHTAKKQAYNRTLLQSCLEKHIRLIDYEYLVENGKRVTAFGKWAGIVGAYNTLRAVRLKFEHKRLTPAHKLNGYIELKESLRQLSLPPVKIVITGTGRVSNGVSEILKSAGITRITSSEFLNSSFNKPVFTRLSPLQYLKHTQHKRFSLKDIYRNPGDFESNFAKYTSNADVYITAHFWHPASPVFFRQQDIKNDNFNIKIIGDISCDIGKPIPTTVRPSTIEEPFYGIDKDTFQETSDYLSDDAITVMAVDNLPNELPRDASESFSIALEKHVFPGLINKGTNSEIIRNATICKNGRLSKPFSYLEDYVKGLA